MNKNIWRSMMTLKGDVKLQGWFDSLGLLFLTRLSFKANFAIFIGICCKSWLCEFLKTFYYISGNFCLKVTVSVSRKTSWWRFFKIQRIFYLNLGILNFIKKSTLHCPSMRLQLHGCWKRNILISKLMLTAIPLALEEII